MKLRKNIAHINMKFISSKMLHDITHIFIDDAGPTPLNTKSRTVKLLKFSNKFSV
jgi:hypothetical protein